MGRSTVNTADGVNGFSLVKQAVHTSGLSSLEKLVFIIIADHANSTRLAWPSIETIAELAGVSPKSGKQRSKIIATIASLEAKGFLKKAGYHGHSRVYAITERVHPVGTLKSTPCGYTNIQYNITPTEASKQQATAGMPSPQCTALASSLADEPQAALASRRGSISDRHWGRTNTYMVPPSAKSILS